MHWSRIDGKLCGRCIPSGARELLTVQAPTRMSSERWNRECLRGHQISDIDSDYGNDYVHFVQHPAELGAEPIPFPKRGRATVMSSSTETPNHRGCTT